MATVHSDRPDAGSAHQRVEIIGPDAHAAAAARVRRARRARDPVARHAALDLPRGGARARPRPGRRRARAARLEARPRGARGVRRRCSSPSFALVLVDGRAGVGADRRVRPRSCPRYWDELTSKPGLPGPHLDGAAPTTRSATRSRSSRPGCPTRRTRCSASPAACSARSSSLVTLTFLALFLLMERPTITDWLFGFTPPEVEARWRPVLEDSIRAVSSSLIGNVAISIVAGTVAGRLGVAARPAVPARARA